MRRRHLRIRRWLVVATALVALVFTATASALPMGDGGGGRAVNARPAVVPSDGSGSFNWWYVVAGAGAALGLAAGGTGIYRAAANRRRVAGLAH
jgi:hypothetical protein